MRRRLEPWIASRLPEAGDAPVVSRIRPTPGNGMSSETVLLEIDRTEGDVTRTEDLVVRIAPDQGNEPVFERYDLAAQFEVLRLVGRLTHVPVPRVRWIEPSGDVIGSPFFVMDRADGVVPPDVMPYTFGDNWLHDASPAHQLRLQESTVGVLAGVHAIPDAESRFSFLTAMEPGETPLRRHLAHTRGWYEFAVSRSARSAIIDRGFAWLDANLPTEEGPAVLSWGDARIGNVLYNDFEPVAVLDWEMAGLGPRELDLGWLVFAQMVFQHLAETFELPGMPHFLRADDVAVTYERLTGHAPVDLRFYLVYAAVQWGIVFLRTGTRSVHFGEMEMPDDLDDLLRHRGLLEQMLET